MATSSQTPQRASQKGSAALPHSPFRQFVFADAIHRRYLLWGATIMALAFAGFKFCYPYPDFFADSYYYIQAAAANSNVSIRPIGYPRFLTLIHHIHHSALLLVSIQYLLLFLSSTYLTFTVLFIFRPTRYAARLLFILVSCNPLYLYLANLVSSDSLFTTLSLYWLALLLWIIYRPRPLHIIAQAFILAAAFSVRYNALYYPFITLVALFFGRTSPAWKTIGFLLSGTLVAGFMYFTIQSNDKETGLRQFSGFSGWQAANNALYMYPHLDTSQLSWNNPADLQIDNHVRHFIDTAHLRTHPIGPRNGALYLVSLNGPLKQYYFNLCRQYPDQPLLWSFNRAGHDFNHYGRQLILHHPLAFARYYLLPNAGAYLLPPLEQFYRYNEGWNNIGQPVVNWFQFQDRQVTARTPETQQYWLEWFPIGFCILNLLLLIGGLRIWRMHALKGLTTARLQCYRLLILVMICNAAFSIFASPIVLRYQVFQLATNIAAFILLLSILAIKKMERHQ